MAEWLARQTHDPGETQGCELEPFLLHRVYTWEMCLVFISSTHQSEFKMSTRLWKLNYIVECFMYLPYGRDRIHMLPRKLR